MLRLALPSKGEMEEPTLGFLTACGLSVDRANLRQYMGQIPAVAGTVVMFQRAPDITAKVEEGSADLGITGYDSVRENRRESSPLAVVIRDLGYSRCQLALGVPQAWIDVTSLGDLAELALEFKERGRELRVATKYPRLSQRFLISKGIYYFSLVESSGAIEAAPAMGYADIIADITSTGATLRENNLKMITGGTLLKSQACLVANLDLLRQHADRQDQARRLLEMMEARLRAGAYFSVTANIRGDSANTVAAAVVQHPDLAGLQGPTVSRVYSRWDSNDWYAVTVVIAKPKLQQAIDELRRLGGNGITVLPAQYVFDNESQAYQRLLSLIARDQPDEDAVFAP